MVIRFLSAMLLMLHALNADPNNHVPTEETPHGRVENDASPHVSQVSQRNPLLRALLEEPVEGGDVDSPEGRTALYNPVRQGCQRSAADAPHDIVVTSRAEGDALLSNGSDAGNQGNEGSRRPRKRSYPSSESETDSTTNRTHASYAGSDVSDLSDSDSDISSDEDDGLSVASRNVISVQDVQDSAGSSADSTLNLSRSSSYSNDSDTDSNCSENSYEASTRF